MPEQPFTMTRQFDAPLQQLIAAWTEADRLAQWWGPKGASTRVVALDLRPGGIFHYVLTMPGGIEMWGKFVFQEVSPPAQISYVSGFANSEGEFVRHPMAPTWPLEVLNLMNFAEDEGGSRLTLLASPYRADDVEKATFAASHPMLEQGFAGSLDKLEEFLAR